MVQRQFRRAYTLLEVTLVLALMVILGAIAYPSLEAMSAGVKVEGAADSVRAAWSEAQAHAVNEGRPYRFAVVPGKGNYRIAPDSDSFWSGGTPPTSGADDPAIAHEGSLPKGIVFTTDGSAAPSNNEDTVLSADGVSPGQWVPTAVFLPDGTAQDDVNIKLELAGVQPMVVHLRALTGVISVERGE
jgi:prepilin-type N-terminal cleavage/methylation domain-containing protein